ncbi:MBL fold metallo-hydrolase [Bacteroidales bacterium OttesenSCG-928-M06]|nr:MBL fold metallo-hydrolase [Bacteroidales bacterium OttesenSCG-928-M06]
MWQYRILETGFFHADGGAMFGAIPKRAWKRKYSADEDNCCVLAMNCVLLWNKKHCILIDTGIGAKNLGSLSYYNFQDTQDITKLIRREGFSPEDITDIILSHLHFDHCGGCTYIDDNNQLQLTFPKALHHVGKEQWENYRAPNPLEEDSYRRQDMLPVYEAGLLHLIEKNDELYPGLVLDIYSGHTPGQLVVSFSSEGNIIIVPGDVIPTKAHISNEWISAYDTHPLESLAAKISFKEKLKNKQASILFYHDAYNKQLDYTFRT